MNFLTVSKDHTKLISGKYTCIKTKNKGIHIYKNSTNKSEHVISFMSLDIIEKNILSITKDNIRFYFDYSDYRCEYHGKYCEYRSEYCGFHNNYCKHHDNNCKFYDEYCEYHKEYCKHYDENCDFHYRYFENHSRKYIDGWCIVIERNCYYGEDHILDHFDNCTINVEYEECRREEYNNYHIYDSDNKLINSIIGEKCTVPFDSKLFIGVVKQRANAHENTYKIFNFETMELGTSMSDSKYNEITMNIENNYLKENILFFFSNATYNALLCISRSQMVKCDCETKYYVTSLKYLNVKSFSKCNCYPNDWMLRYLLSIKHIKNIRELYHCVDDIQKNEIFEYILSLKKVAPLFNYDIIEHIIFFIYN